MATGLGAWYHVYQRGDGVVSPLKTERERMIAAAVLSIKKELAFRGYDDGLVLDQSRFGGGAYGSVKDFQTDHGLHADGKVGSVTAKQLYLSRVLAMEATAHIPNNLLARVIQQESAWDPGAQGFFTPSDRGLVQINFDFHPGVTRKQAADGAFAVSFASHALTGTFVAFGDWDAAVAAYNVGVVPAKEWLDAGKPETTDGQPLEPDPDNPGQFLNETAEHRYLRMVLRQAI